jgi:ABC-2 type transport system ATP-binding protein
MAFADQRSGTLSHGNAQRLGLAKALLHHPKLLILDEPTNGLDPAGIVEIRELLLNLVHEQGVTVFMSSHLLDEVSRLVNRIGIIHRGKLIQELDVAEIESNRQRRLKVRTRDDTHALGILRAAGIQAVFLIDGEIVIGDATAIDQPEHIATLLVHAGCPPASLNVQQEDLEHYFLRLVGMDGRSEGFELL